MSPITANSDENRYVFAEWKDVVATEIYSPAPEYVYGGASLARWTITPDEAAATAAAGGGTAELREDADDLAASLAAKADGSAIPYAQVRAKLGL